MTTSRSAQQRLTTSLGVAPETDEMPAPRWLDARVKVVVDHERYLLDSGCLARRASSCLLKVHGGDRVMAVVLADDSAHIVHILERNPANSAVLSLADSEQLSIHQHELVIDCQQRLALRSLGDTEITAATGTLSLQGRNVFTAATDSLIQHSGHWIARMGHALVEAGELLRMHGKQTLLTAEHDVKIDAERISMG